ncbi:TANK-binding kinase 1-binding protein [Scophthalmus maximus]|uniref:TANK-binding kinase 1-binding protein n=1 Tax=Scophthalmus maximus TaxID=52904 RepID=A0A2U9CQN6_SCOMX|nr:TANK-binding kinase 1-binding protein [Scophthalmus maximus]
MWGPQDDGCGSVAWRSSPLPPEDVYSASHFALITAYQDIKTRLVCLERENTSIKRKLKIYEIKFPMINEFGEDTNSYCSFESKETALLHSENGNLQQRVNVLTHELQKRKEREEQLEDVIQAYEKIHMEKSNLQRDLDKMSSLVEKHVERILNLESALRQRENSLQKLNIQLHSKDIQYLQLHAGPDAHLLDCPALTLQSSRSLDALSDLKLQRLEAELEGARHEAQGACQREDELKAECERLKEEMRQLQKGQREREMTSPCKQCDVEWIKKVGDEQVNLALAYTELTEELGRLQALSSKQMEILRKASQEQASPVQRHSPIHHQRHSPVTQRHSPISQRHSPVPPPPHHSPIQQRRSPVLQRLSPDMHRRSPLLDVNSGPASYSCRPPSQHLRASFQGRRSYSEVADPSAYHCPPRFSLDPVATLPKPRPYVDGYAKQQAQHVGSPHGGLQHRGSPSHHQDEEEWTCPHPISPPRTLGVLSAAAPSGVMRGPASCSAFPIPQRPNTLSCHPQSGYMSAEHAQSWPSINLWMETEESDMRSCPLCQLIFPVGYPDDALIKHIDSHLENSKI